MFIISQVFNGFLSLYAEGSKSRAPDKDFQSLTVERLRALLKEKGLSLRGKKASIIVQKHCYSASASFEL